MQPASMWTRKDVKEFKESIRKEGGDAIIKVGHGETVTVSSSSNLMQLFEDVSNVIFRTVKR